MIKGSFMQAMIALAVASSLAGYAIFSSVGNPSIPNNNGNNINPIFGGLLSNAVASKGGNSNGNNSDNNNSNNNSNHNNDNSNNGNNNSNLNNNSNNNNNSNQNSNSNGNGNNNDNSNSNNNNSGNNNSNNNSINGGSNGNNSNNNNSNNSDNNNSNGNNSNNNSSNGNSNGNNNSNNSNNNNSNNDNGNHNGNENVDEPLAKVRAFQDGKSLDENNEGIAPGADIDCVAGIEGLHSADKVICYLVPEGIPTPSYKTTPIPPITTTDSESCPDDAGFKSDMICFTAKFDNNLFENGHYRFVAEFYKDGELVGIKGADFYANHSFFVVPESPVGSAALVGSSLAGLGGYFFFRGRGFF